MICVRVIQENPDICSGTYPGENSEGLSANLNQAVPFHLARGGGGCIAYNWNIICS